MKKRIFIIGPPGAGKGTLSRAIQEKVDLKHVSIGKIFRKNIKKGTPLGKIVEPYVNAGKLVPDKYVIDLVIDRLNKSDVKEGYIFDGFPRTKVQAEKLAEAIEKGSIKVDAIIQLDVPDEIVVTRTANRRYCEDKNCGAHYNLFDNPPKDGKTCDKDGKGLITRPDDAPEIVKTRLAQYHAETEPAIALLKQKGLIDAIEYSSPKDIADKAFKLLGMDKLDKDPMVVAPEKTSQENTHNISFCKKVSRAINFALANLPCTKKKEEFIPNF